jgi:hypothetical protein
VIRPDFTQVAPGCAFSDHSVKRYIAIAIRARFALSLTKFGQSTVIYECVVHRSQIILVRLPLSYTVTHRCKEQLRFQRNHCLLNWCHITAVKLPLIDYLLIQPFVLLSYTEKILCKDYGQPEANNGGNSLSCGLKGSLNIDHSYC